MARRIRNWLWAGLVIGTQFAIVSAQDTKTAEQPAAAEKEKPAVAAESPATEAPAAAWKKAQARKLEIFNRLQALQKDFAKATRREEKLKLRDEYTQLLNEFDISIQTRILELAPAIYAANPEDLDAAEVVMQQAFNENKYSASGEIAKKLIQANRKTKSALTVHAVSLFAQQQFEEAVTAFNEASQQKKLSPEFAGYVDTARQYVDFWKKESAIREREQALTGDKALPLVEFDTTKGKIIFELFEDQAPNTVKNFVSLVESKTYDGTTFHRVENGFMAQGGDPNTLNDDPSDDGRGGPGYTIKCECFREDARLHFAGSLSMAHTRLNDTGGSQFFITHLPTAHLNPETEPERRGHTVFGRVVEGLDVSAALRRGDKIKLATVTRKRPGQDYKPEVTPDPKAEAEEKGKK